jgi:hypothetical protein
VIIAVANRKASPGATTVAALLAARWDEDGATRFIVEADPSGGTLAARWSEAHGVSWNPGLVDLAMVRGAADARSLAAVSQPLAPGVQLCAAPSAPSQVVTALSTIGDTGAALLAGAAGARSFVDCGRLDGRSPAIPLARRAVVTLLVLRPVLDEINTAFAGIVDLAAAGCRVGLVLVGRGHWSADEIANAADVEVFGELPDDPRAAKLFANRGLGAGRAFQRTQLAGAAAELASTLQLVSASVRVPVPQEIGSATTLPLAGPTDPGTPADPLPPAPTSLNGGGR